MDNRKGLVSVVLTAIMVILVFVAIVSTGSEIQSISCASEPELSISGEAIPGQVIVGFKDVMTASDELNAIAVKHGGVIIDRNPALNCVLLKVDDAQEFTQRISKESPVEYAEPNYLVKALYTPNDFYYSQQWGPSAIKADLAWDTEKGDYGNITIAIVDTGIDYNHEDLVNYVSGGYDWINMDNDPWDDYGHGTHCAGIAAAVMDNEIGVAGIAQVKVMAEKVLNETGFGSVWNVSQGIRHAADNGTDVISMSLGDYSYSSTLEDACQYAWDAGCILTGAAGNDNQYGICYPAKFDTVICVGAINDSNSRVSFSNWGPEMELVAPGLIIKSTCRGDDYCNMSGTSMATPHVAGVAALVWSNCPELTNQQVRDRMNDTADDLGTMGWDEEYGWGIVDASAALGGGECEGTDTSCGIYPSCENCNDYDVCYAYGNGCEKRNYYCNSNEVGCEYTYSNRHTDYYDDWDYYCKGDEVWKRRLFHDFYCEAGNCTDHTSWRNDTFVENCNTNDSWYDTGNTTWITDPADECKEKEQKEQEYRDYTCSIGTCNYSVTNTRWIDTGNTRNKPDGTICGCTANNTLKECYEGICSDTGICNSTMCGAGADCDGKKPGESCDTNKKCNSNCKCQCPEVIFNTEQSENPYPSIFGTHNGTITPNQTITVSKMYTYPCQGTGGHSEYAAFYNATTGVEIANGTWNGYQGAGDYRHIELNEPFILHANVTYNYTICTGSYPQIHHTDALQTANGWINCTEFVDANGKKYNNWIPAIRLE